MWDSPSSPLTHTFHHRQPRTVLKLAQLINARLTDTCWSNCYGMLLWWWGVSTFSVSGSVRWMLTSITLAHPISCSNRRGRTRCETLVSRAPRVTEYPKADLDSSNTYMQIIACISHIGLSTRSRVSERVLKPWNSYSSRKQDYSDESRSWSTQ